MTTASVYIKHRQCYKFQIRIIFYLNLKNERCKAYFRLFIIRDRNSRQKFIYNRYPIYISILIAFRYYIRRVK